MKRRLLKKVVKRLTPASPARFRYNEKVKAAWIQRMERVAPPPSVQLHHFDIDSKGNPIPCGLWRWAYLFEFQSKKRIIRQTDLEDCKVSTVFLGMDHGWGRVIPVTFESLVFGGALDGEMERYTTREAALIGHKLLVNRCAHLPVLEEIAS